MTAQTLDSRGGVEQFGYRQELRRSLAFADLLDYGLVYMVVIAPFGIFGSVFQASAGMVALAYAIGMLAMMVTASSYGVMAQAFPTAGSVYTYAGRACRSAPAKPNKFSTPSSAGFSLVPVEAPH